MQSFVSDVWANNYDLPTYARWLLSQNTRDSYRRYVNVLRLIGAREPHKRWLLKSPAHMAEIDTLLEVFPDACFIQTHRDPVKTIPSLCSLRHMVARELQGEGAKPHVIGPRQCAYWRDALARTQLARQQLPLQFFDVDHRRFMEDPLGVVHSIYAHFRLMLSPHTEGQMRAWVAARPSHRDGGHQYAMHSWGVTPDQISEIFADYRKQHDFH